MKKNCTFFISVFASLLLVGCTGETVDYSEEPSKPETPVDDQETPVDASVIPSGIPEINPPSAPSASLGTIPEEYINSFNDFSLKFYLANSAGNNDNVCVSPFSVGAVLGMIANGDDGKARNEILRVLGFEESKDGMNALNAYYQTLLSNLPNLEDDITWNVTNTMWCDPSRYQIRNSFMQTLTDSYYGYAIGVNPGGESGKDVINAFVNEQTHGLIENFLTKPLDVRLAFLNTVYFKGGWNLGFDEYMTSERSFLTIDGKEKKTDFMWGCNYTEYVMTEDGTEAVRLNYGENERFSMTFILPSSRINHIPLDEALTSDNFSAIDKNLKEERMIVRIPKFEVESNNPNTIDILKALGLQKDRNKPFRLITEMEEFYLTCFIHSTKLKVDENGTEAAAVSLGGMVETVGPGGDTNTIREIVFNRPFVFYVRENTTGAILFIGSVKTLP